MPSDDGSSPYLASTSLKRMSEDTGRDSQPRNSSQLARVIEEETSATPVAQQQYLTANNRSWHSRHSIDLGVMSGAASFHGVETAGDAQSLQDEGSKGKRKMKGMLKSMLKVKRGVCPCGSTQSDRCPGELTFFSLQGLKGFQTGTGSKGQRQSS